VGKRSKKIEMDMKRLMEEALQKKKQKDTRGKAITWHNLTNPIGAIFALKRKKMLEKEVAKLDGQMVLLEQQRMAIESKDYDQILGANLTHYSKHSGHTSLLIFECGFKSRGPVE
jgi:hypothetical protein